MATPPKKPNKPPRPTALNQAALIQQLARYPQDAICLTASGPVVKLEYTPQNESFPATIEFQTEEDL